MIIIVHLEKYWQPCDKNKFLNSLQSMSYCFQMLQTDKNKTKNKSPHPLTKDEHHVSTKRKILIFLPSFLSCSELGIINYWLKYTVEVFSTGMRSEEEGKLCDLLTYKLLTPRLSPGCLPESSQKLRAKHHIWTSSVWPRHVLSLEVLAWTSVHLGEGPREKAGRDERYWGWIVSMIKIQHSPWTFSPICVLFFSFFYLPSFISPFVCTLQRLESWSTSERHADNWVLSGFELWAAARCVCLTIW